MREREELGRQASIDGFAHEHIVVGLLMKKYQNVSLVDLPLSTYDIVIVRKIIREKILLELKLKQRKTQLILPVERGRSR